MALPLANANLPILPLDRESDWSKGINFLTEHRYGLSVMRPNIYGSAGADSFEIRQAKKTADKLSEEELAERRKDQPNFAKF
jgi:hypothetical protein